jgi:Arc/MetJ-type ribon-helix-helix transcriptional regulator
MSTNIEIPADLQPAISAAISMGAFADEQELVNEILRATLPALAQYQQLRRDVQASVDQAERGKVRPADFDSVRDRLCEEFNEDGSRR